MHRIEDLLGKLFLESSAITLLKLECLKVRQFDDLWPLSRGGCATVATAGGKEGEREGGRETKEQVEYVQCS